MQNRIDFVCEVLQKKAVRIVSIFIVGIFAIASDAKESLFDPLALNDSSIVYLEQNWSDSDREYFYYTDQGSRLLAYDLFLHLEQAGSDELLRSPHNILRMGFIPGKAGDLNPDALPIGFTRNEDYMGLTCAACHTQQLKYGNKIVRIDGGQGMGDLTMLMRAMAESIKATLADENKLKRLHSKLSGAERKEVRRLLTRELATMQDLLRRNRHDVPYGFSRLDAFGAILNKALYLTGVPDNFRPPNAPASNPYIWDTPQHDYVEWNGSQSNTNVGALARNVGEVIGVFGEVETESSSWLGLLDGGYASSVQTANLRELEKTVARLQSPLWPGFFPTVDKALATQGRVLYQQYCGQCHLDIVRGDPKRHIKVRMSTIDKVGTDPLMASNAVSARGKSGIYAGKKRYYQAGDEIGVEAPAIAILNNIMVGILRNNPLQVYLAKRDARALGHGDEIHPPKYVNGKIVPHGEEVSEVNLLAYKARPLNGIWATAPYLHNGSVPNLYELLLPAEQRSTRFYLGTLEYDTDKVGYVSKASGLAFEFNTELPGNSNAGHEYGKGPYGKEPFLEEEILALLEYMKTL